MSIDLRPYQALVIAEFQRCVERGDRSILLVAPTGSGKTVIGAAIINCAIALGHRVLVIAHRREIITQTRDKLVANGVNPGIVLAGFETELRPYANVQVAGIQTLHARAIRSNRMPMPAATYLIIDEAHHARASSYQKVLDAYPDAVVIGLTATPVRGDGRGLGNIFETMVEAPQIAELIKQGHLVPTKVYAPVDRDVAKGVQTQTGDYVVSALSARMNTDQLVGDVVADWLRHGERRRTVAFAVDVAHSVHIRNAFLEFDVRAEHLDGSTPKTERDAILARLASGETEVVSNCAVLTEGWDMPAVGCLILARPTRQLGLYRQMVGRVLRPAEGKIDAIILDHSGAVYRHGLPEDHIEWTLDIDRRAENPTQARRERGEEPKLRECPSCKTVMAAPPCHACGWMPAPRRGQDRDFADGELGLVVSGKAQAGTLQPHEQLQFYRELRGFARDRGFKDGWAFHQCEKRGFTPPWTWRDYPILDPSPTTKAWARSRMIAYAKAKQREAAI
jgi:DNA repair protein RadD